LQAIDDDFDVVFLGLGEFGRLIGQQMRPPVHDGATEALLSELAKKFRVFAFATPDDRRENLELLPLSPVKDAVDDLLRRLPGNGLAALGAVWPTGAREQQAQVIVDLGNGAHRRTRVARGGLLIDRYCWRQTLNEVNVRFVHLAEELAGIGRQ
jgi:hypothetical protein